MAVILVPPRCVRYILHCVTPIIMEVKNDLLETKLIFFWGLFSISMTMEERVVVAMYCPILVQAGGVSLREKNSPNKKSAQQTIYSS